MRRRLALLGLAAVAVAFLAAGSCQFGSSGSSGSSGGTADASPAGIWSGTDSVTGLGITALISSTGKATFIRADGVQFAGPVRVSGDALAVTVNGYTDFGATFHDGSNFGIGTLNGTVATGATLDATLTFTTHGGTAQSGTWSLRFEPRSNTASGTGTISGNYTDTATGAVVSISSSGVMTSQNASNGCVLNGSISSSDASLDIYDVAFNYGDCTGTYAVLNGVQFTGLASLDSSLSPAQIILAVAGAAAGQNYGIVATLDAS